LPAALTIVSESDLPYDPGTLARKCDGDPAFIRHLVRLYLDDYPQQAQVLRTALDNRDLERLYSISHSVKGAVSHFGARQAVSAAEAVESCCRRGDIDLAAPQAGSLLVALEQLARALQKDYGSD
jgi:HPt (histidine-containing phosphotransfer) domain-containing protein